MSYWNSVRSCFWNCVHVASVFMKTHTYALVMVILHMQPCVHNWCPTASIDYSKHTLYREHSRNIWQELRMTLLLYEDKRYVGYIYFFRLKRGLSCQGDSVNVVICFNKMVTCRRGNQGRLSDEWGEKMSTCWNGGGGKLFLLQKCLKPVFQWFIGVLGTFSFWSMGRRIFSNVSRRGKHFQIRPRGAGVWTFLRFLGFPRVQNTHEILRIVVSVYGVFRN